MQKNSNKTSKLPISKDSVQLTCTTRCRLARFQEIPTKHIKFYTQGLHGHGSLLIGATSQSVHLIDRAQMVLNPGAKDTVNLDVMDTILNRQMRQNSSK